MLKRIFSATELARIIRAGDPERFDLDLSNDRKAILEAASEIVTQNKVDLAAYKSFPIRGKMCATYDDFHAHLALRAIARHLQQRHKIKIPNRERIIRGVLESLMDATPMTIIRRDITSFYESIPVKPLRDSLIFDTASPQLVRTYLKQYFDAHCPGPYGLPRGIGLSAILVELAMRDFDKRTRAINGVYKYYRFSDDIIIFSYLPAAVILPALNASLEGEMKFNPAKSSLIKLTQDDPKAARLVEFEYLGYRFTMSNYSGGRDSREVTASISRKKLKKIKSKIVLSLMQYSQDRDFRLLFDRLQYVSSNYSVRRNGFAMSGGATHVKSGIFYNYRQCGSYSFSNRRVQYFEHDPVELRELDDFLFGLIKAKRSPYRALLTRGQMDELSILSFYKGFTGRISVRFRPLRVAEIKSVWLHV